MARRARITGGLPGVKTTGTPLSRPQRWRRCAIWSPVVSKNVTSREVHHHALGGRAVELREQPLELRARAEIDVAAQHDP